MLIKYLIFLYILLLQIPHIFSGNPDLCAQNFSKVKYTHTYHDVTPKCLPELVSKGFIIAWCIKHIRVFYISQKIEEFVAYGENNYMFYSTSSTTQKLTKSLKCLQSSDNETTFTN